MDARCFSSSYFLGKPEYIHIKGVTLNISEKKDEYITCRRSPRLFKCEPENCVIKHLASLSSTSQQIHLKTIPKLSMSHSLKVR